MGEGGGMGCEGGGGVGEGEGEGLVCWGWAVGGMRVVCFSRGNQGIGIYWTGGYIVHRRSRSIVVTYFSLVGLLGQESDVLFAWPEGGF